jgi:hypothetical protein
MAKPALNWSTSPSRRREQLAEHSRQASVGRSVANRLGPEAAVWVSPSSVSGWLAHFVFAFHDDDELGPRMLSRIAKHAGLQQSDL